MTKGLTALCVGLLASCGADGGERPSDTRVDSAPADVIFGGEDTRDTATPDSAVPPDSAPADADDVTPEADDLADGPDSDETVDTAETGDTGDDAVDSGPDVPPDVAPFCGDGVCDPDEACPDCADCPCPERCGDDLFFSEYLEGTSWNKALEIANFTGHDVDLSDYAVWKITNGGDWSEAAPRALPLDGVLAAGAVLVLCHGDADAAVRAECDVVSSVDAMEFNGDDALALARNGAIIDVIGEDGADPGQGWTVGAVSDATFDHTLRRKPDVVAGAELWSAAAPTWDVLGLDFAAGLGALHVAARCVATPPPPAALNEIAAGSGAADFIEIAAAAEQEGPLDLSGWTLASTGGSHVLPPGSTLAPGAFLALSGTSLGFGLGLVDNVWLYDADGAPLDLLGWTASDLGAGASYGRLPDVTGRFAPNSRATPGAPNENPDYWCGDGTCQPDEDCTTCLDDCVACAPAPGDLVVTEVVASTAGAEWFEVTSVAATPLELSGMLIRDDGSDAHVISASFVVAPGAIVVFAGAPFAPADYLYADVRLDDADAIALATDALIDRVSWTSAALGKARALSGDVLDAAANDADDAWCDAPATPGLPNAPCPRCGDTHCDPDEDCASCAADCDLCRACASDLFFSEYFEGTSFSKALEVANMTGAPVDLTHYAIWRITNGGSTWAALADSAKVPLAGTLAPGAVWVGCNTSSTPALTALCDQLYGQGSAPTNFNGDDALALVKDGVIIDVIGAEAEDPGAGWTLAGVADATVDHTLVRRPEIVAPNADWSSASGEWIVLELDDLSGLGAHAAGYLCEP